MRTHNNDYTNYSTGNPLVEFFSKAGSLFKGRKSYYGAQTEASALELFFNAWAVDKLTAFKLLLWCRDIRGGAGNRSGSREILRFLATKEPEWVRLNLVLIPEYGRWDDLLVLFDTPVQDQAFAFWAEAIQRGDGLAAKWAPRENKSHPAEAKALRKAMGLTPKAYRQLLANTTTVVETPMCNGRWDAINYNHVPSVAVGRYAKAFERHDPARYQEWLAELQKPASSEKKAKVNAGAIFPHDCVRLAEADGINGFIDVYFRPEKGHKRDSDLANAQFEAMPDYFKPGTRAVCLVDLSGSMSTRVSGSVQAIDVAVGLGMYASDRLGAENPFYRKFIPFSSSACFYDWTGKTFSQGLADLANEERYYGSTNVAAALNLLVKSGKFFNATNDQMPNMLIIISDMQFDQGVSMKETTVQNALKRWRKAGYDIPQIVYWDTAGYVGSPATVFENVGLISGFSPATLSAVFDAEDFTPMAILERAIAKYEVTIPNAA